MFKGDQTSIWGQPCLPWSQNTPSHNSGECTNIPTTTICTNNNNPTTTNKTLPPDISGACPWAPRSRLNPPVDLDPGHLGRPSIPLNPHRHPLQARLLQVIDLLLCEETSFHLKKGWSNLQWSFCAGGKGRRITTTKAQSRFVFFLNQHFKTPDILWIIKSPKHDKMQKKVKVWSRLGEQQPNAISINFSSWLCTEAGVFLQVS